MLDHTIDRRSFLKLGGVLIVTFSLDGMLNSAPAYVASTGKSRSLTDVASFLVIGGDGKVTIYCGHVDLGTGVQTAIGQIAAEELDVSFDRVSVIQGDTALTSDQGIIHGSLSMQLAGMQIRQAAATAREALLVNASDRLASPAYDLAIADGVVSSKASGNKISYAELIRGSDLSLTVDKQVRLRAPADYTIVGKSVARMVGRSCRRRWRPGSSVSTRLR